MIHSLSRIVIFVFLSISYPAFSQWQDRSNPSLGDIIRCKFISPQNGWTINLSDPPYQGLLHTTDGGITWTRILDHQPGTFNWIYSFDFLDDSVGYASPLRAVRCFRTLNGGQEWDTVGCSENNVFGDMRTIGILRPDLAYAGTGIQFYRSVDTLRSWQRISYLPQGGVFSPEFKFIFLSPTTVIACGGTPSLLDSKWTGTIECYKSTNGGLTWEYPFVDTLAMPYAAAFGNGSVGCTFSFLGQGNLGPHYKTHKTTDGGNSWFQIPATIDTGVVQVTDAYFKNPRDGFITGGAVAHSSDGGLTWHTIPGISGAYMSWPDSLNGWIVGSNGRIFRTTTGGLVPALFASFTGEHTGGTRVRVHWRTRSETNTAGFHLQRRSEGDTTFADISSLIPGQGTTSEPSDYSFTDTTATISRWYYRLKVMPLTGAAHYSNTILVDVTTGVTSGLTQYEYKLEQNFPNPFNPTTQIRFDISTAGIVTLKVYDVLGREVHTLVNEHLEPGNYHRVFDGVGLASGVYYYNLTAPGYSKTRKFVVIK